MAADDSITGGLGLEEACFDELKTISQKRFSENQTISDALEAIAEDVRDNTLGEANLRVSQYEKKLILAGYITGLVRSENKIKELKMITSLVLASKSGGIEEIDGGFSGCIDLSGMPKELQMLLRGLLGGEQNDDDDDE